MLRTLWAAALLLAICATIHTTASAEDPEWFVKKDTWVETYTESLLAMQRLEREAGETIPAPRNDESLPVVLVCENQLSLRDVPLDVDVSGIKTLYIGSTSWMHVRDCVLIKNDGTEEPLLKETTRPFRSRRSASAAAFGRVGNSKPTSPTRPSSSTASSNGSSER